MGHDEHDTILNEPFFNPRINELPGHNNAS